MAVDRKRIFLALAAATVLAGVVRASLAAFVCDDAFISFRYAKNLISGLGLVFNAGERVEGYTNFLWTMLIAAAMKLGMDPVRFTIAGGIAAHAATLALFAYYSWKSAGASAGRIVLPLTSLLLVAHRDFNVYATSGLETSWVTFLVSAACIVLFLGTAGRSMLLAGTLMALAMLTRPDAVVPAAGMALVIAVARRKGVLAFLLPCVVLFLPYWLWRWGHFGYFFPNSFYAKSIDLPYYDQGLTYTWMFFKSYYVFLLIPLLAALWLVRRRRTETAPVHPVALASVLIVLQLLFVIRIGGDFMFARFFVVVTPLLCLLLELFLVRLFSGTAAAAAGLAAVAGIVFHLNLFADRSLVGYVADEPAWYPMEKLRTTEEQGKLLGRLLGGLPVRVAAWGSSISLVYYADAPYVVEATTGLTDTTLAHTAVAQRGRPGHEKEASVAYMRSRRVNFLFIPRELPPQDSAFDRIDFGPVAAVVIGYDARVMDALAQRPGVRFQNFPEFLDVYIGALGSLEPERVRRDYAQFKEYYFDYTSDPERERRLAAYVR